MSVGSVLIPVDLPVVSEEDRLVFVVAAGEDEQVLQVSVCVRETDVLLYLYGEFGDGGPCAPRSLILGTGGSTVDETRKR